MGKINWSGYEWITEERWGNIHPEKMEQWYDPSCVSIDNNGYLHLKTKYNPKYFGAWNITSYIGVGLVSCTKEFHFGSFEIEAKLPRGRHLWPAFWMWSWYDWPPEIDILEGYSDGFPNYFHFNPFKPKNIWKVETNVHYKIDGKKGDCGGKTHDFGFKDPTKNFIKYRADWSKDRVAFYYDEKLVRVIEDPEILKDFNNTKMNVIINNAVTKRVNPKNPPNSDFIIKYFKYEPLFT